MKTMGWLIRREFWEHKGMLLWQPLAIAGLMLAFTLVMVVLGQNAEIHLDMPEGKGGGVIVQLGAEHRQAIVDFVAAAYPLAAAPLYLTMAFMVLFYSMGALIEERRDRSLLFWKSLPVSDRETVLSKAALALLLIPLGVVAIGLATALLITLLALGGLALKGTNVLPLLLTSGQFWLTPLKLVALVPVYLLWALPAVGWLLMVSSWARSKVFLWAVGAPLLATMLLAWASRVFALNLDMQWIFSNILGRVLISVMPGSWFALDALRLPVEQAAAGAHVATAAAHRVTDAIVVQSWATLGTPQLWLGAVAGAAMLGVAIWMRRYREED